MLKVIRVYAWDYYTGTVLATSSVLDEFNLDIIRVNDGICNLMPIPKCSKLKRSTTGPGRDALVH